MASEEVWRGEKARQVGLFLMAGMVGMAGKDRESAIDLLCEDKASEGVRQSHWPQRKKELRAIAGDVRPTAGRADGEGDLLGSRITPTAKPSGEGFGGHGLATAVEQHGEDGRAPLCLFEPGKEGRFGFEGLRIAPSEGCAAIEVKTRERVKIVFRAGVRTDVGESEKHPVENTLKEKI